ncbi:MAG: endonuclease Q family protein [Candidatus Curtissbacteria bacterium]|nr:endonuclease Q family protein [Candidatus Curtissbacteria bacterium]
MKFVADLHLHSRYSRAVSQQMNLQNMAQFARLKGISVLATGDFTHPFWFDHIKNQLEETAEGLYRLKQPENSPQQTVVSNEQSASEIFFLLSCEISSIYSQGGKGRRIHNLVMFPKLSDVEKFNNELIKRRVNLRSDGRPIVGLSAKDVAYIALEVSDKALVIPAHAWTPWFSLYGSFSGFDSVEECFGDMAKYIYGIESGLSSDPAMNWEVGDLDNRSILSFSDAHSLEKMGREVTVFEANNISYDAIYGAISGSSTSRIAFTIEFYPEEGKYHFTGHRDCNVSLSPAETREKGEKCSVCGRSLTVGVMHRVEELKTINQKQETRDKNGVKWIYPDGESRPPFISLVPLYEIIAEALEVGVGTQKVNDQYMSLVNVFGSEFNVLLKAELEKIVRFGGSKLSEAIGKVRSREIVVEPGFDGKFGIVKIWSGTTDVSGQKDEESQLNLLV